MTGMCMSSCSSLFSSSAGCIWVEWLQIDRMGMWYFLLLLIALIDWLAWDGERSGVLNV
jgi:hypothetical protein